MLLLLEKGYSLLVFCNSAQHSIYFLPTSHHYIKFAISEWNVASTMVAVEVTDINYVAIVVFT